MTSRSKWRQAIAPESASPNIWEVFHQNSKITGHEARAAPSAEAARVAGLWETLPHELAPSVALPPFEEARGHLRAVDLVEAMAGRRSPREGFAPVVSSLPALSATLSLGYGLTHDERDAGFPRAFRAVPSGGALYPLELYVVVCAVEGVARGLYHYHPPGHALRGWPDAQRPSRLAGCFVQPEFVETAAFTVLLTALPERSTGKYGNRGYRFALIEAGHVAQNLCLAAEALGFAAQVLGGFLDDRLDRELELDGIRHSTLYCVALGGRAPA